MAAAGAAHVHREAARRLHRQAEHVHGGDFLLAHERRPAHTRGVDLTINERSFDLTPGNNVHLFTLTEPEHETSYNVAAQLRCVSAFRDRRTPWPRYGPGKVPVSKLVDRGGIEPPTS